mgnify:CR=1 FL=1
MNIVDKLSLEKDNNNNEGKKSFLSNIPAAGGSFATLVLGQTFIDIFNVTEISKIITYASKFSGLALYCLFYGYQSFSEFRKDFKQPLDNLVGQLITISILEGVITYFVQAPLY